MSRRKDTQSKRRPKTLHASRRGQSTLGDSNGRACELRLDWKRHRVKNTVQSLWLPSTVSQLQRRLTGDSGHLPGCWQPPHEVCFHFTAEVILPPISAQTPVEIAAMKGHKLKLNKGLKSMMNLDRYVQSSSKRHLRSATLRALATQRVCT
jgi:hypothetical protein